MTPYRATTPGRPVGARAVQRRAPAGGRARMRALAILAAVALALVLAGCAGSSSSNSILLYNGQHPQVTSELVAAFEKRTGIKVNVHTNDGIVLADQLLQEGSSSPADVYLTENSPELVTIDEHGLFT